MKNQTNPVSLLDDKVKCKYLATVFAGENLTPVFFFCRFNGKYKFVFNYYYSMSGECLALFGGY